MDLFIILLLTTTSLITLFLIFCFGMCQNELYGEKIPFVNAYKGMLSFENKTPFNKIIYGLLVGLLGVAWGLFLLLYFVSVIVAVIIFLIGEVLSLIFLKPKFFLHNVWIRKNKLDIFYRKANLDIIKKEVGKGVFRIVSDEKTDDILNFEIQINDSPYEPLFQKICEFHYSKENKCWDIGLINENIEERWIKLCQKIL